MKSLGSFWQGTGLPTTGSSPVHSPWAQCLALSSAGQRWQRAGRCCPPKGASSHRETLLQKRERCWGMAKNGNDAEIDESLYSRQL
ncbi:hypothetical protein chiPu_0028611, partial [Chiloscyllium punctatum]|nr:hypothetical protein [Chiloscyllium punctatum]